MTIQMLYPKKMVAKLNERRSVAISAFVAISRTRSASFES